MDKPTEELEITDFLNKKRTHKRAPVARRREPEQVQERIECVKPADLCLTVVNNQIAFGVFNIKKDKVKLLHNGSVYKLSNKGQLFYLPTPENEKDENNNSFEYSYLGSNNEEYLQFYPLILNSYRDKIPSAISKDGDVYLGDRVSQSLAIVFGMTEEQKKLTNRTLDLIYDMGYKPGFNADPKGFLSDLRHRPMDTEIILTFGKHLTDIKEGKRTTREYIDGIQECDQYRNF